MKKTKIVCTMGPNSNDENIMRLLVKEGMDIARFNFSHGSHEEQKGRMDMLKKIREEEKKPVAILLDTKGPEIRTGKLKDGKKVTLKEGDLRPQPRRTEEPERVEEEQVTIGSLAMPSLSAAQLASRVKQAGDAPDIVKDDITNVTLFDYSDIIGSDTDATEE